MPPGAGVAAHVAAADPRRAAMRFVRGAATVQVQIVQNPERPGRERSTSGTNGAAAVPPGRHCEREAPPPGAALSCIISEQHVEVGPALGGATITGCWRCGGAKPTSVAVTLLPPSAVSHADDLAAFIAHVNALRTLEHPNVLRFYGVVLTQPLTMVSELAPLGSLRDALRQRRCNRPPAARPQPPLLLRLAAQVAAALAFLEGRGCVHRLPAARRVFLASGGELAKLAVPEAPSRPRPRGAAPPRGTGRRRWWRPLPHGWWAPETLRSGTFSHASDAWTFGVLLWEMFTGGKDPWQGLSVAKVLQRLQRGGERLPCPPSCPRALYELMLCCWRLAPHQRPPLCRLEGRVAQVQLRVASAVSDSPQLDGIARCADRSSAPAGYSAESSCWWHCPGRRALHVAQFPPRGAASPPQATPAPTNSPGREAQLPWRRQPEHSSPSNAAATAHTDGPRLKETSPPTAATSKPTYESSPVDADEEENVCHRKVPFRKYCQLKSTGSKACRPPPPPTRDLAGGGMVGRPADAHAAGGPLSLPPAPPCAEGGRLDNSPSPAPHSPCRAAPRPLCPAPRSAVAIGDCGGGGAIAFGGGGATGGRSHYDIPPCAAWSPSSRVADRDSRLPAVPPHGHGGGGVDFEGNGVGGDADDAAERSLDSDSVFFEGGCDSTLDLLSNFYASATGAVPRTAAGVCGAANRAYERESVAALRELHRASLRARDPPCRAARASAPASCDSEPGAGSTATTPSPGGTGAAEERPEVPPRAPIPPLPAKRNGYRWSAEVSYYMWGKDCLAAAKAPLRESLSWGGDGAERQRRPPVAAAPESSASWDGGGCGEGPAKAPLRESLSSGSGDGAERPPPKLPVRDSPLPREGAGSPSRPPRVPPRGASESGAGFRAVGCEAAADETAASTERPPRLPLRRSPSLGPDGEAPPRVPPREPLSPSASRTPSPKGFGCSSSPQPIPGPLPPCQQQQQAALSSSPQRTMPPTQSFGSDPKFSTLGKEKGCCSGQPARGPCILPIIKDGKKQSSTHYYLLPEKPAYLDRYERFLRESDPNERSQPPTSEPARTPEGVCEEFSRLDSLSAQEQIRQVLECVHGVTTEECHAALHGHAWDVPQAIHYLKIEQLLSLGLASRAECQRLLERFDSNLEQASSFLLESCRTLRHR
ncbi:activated CDC42 kinase 1-like [Lampetra fluviatilis]